jgi:hypothetical protein
VVRRRAEDADRHGDAQASRAQGVAVDLGPDVRWAPARDPNARSERLVCSVSQPEAARDYKSPRRNADDVTRQGCDACAPNSRYRHEGEI